jgi:hypothetical protein
MTVIRSILLTALMFWPATGWGQVFTSPRSGVLRGVELQPGMQRGLVDPGMTVGPPSGRNAMPFDGGSQEFDPERSAQYNGDAAGGAVSDTMNGPRSAQYGPATEGYPARGPVNAKTGARTGRKPAPSFWQNPPSAKGGYFGVMGAVGTPAVYFHKSDRIPLIALVQLAGGTTEQANGSVRIVRQGRGGLQTFLSETSVFEVLNGDIVYLDSQPLVRQSGLRDDRASHGSIDGVGRSGPAVQNAEGTAAKAANPAQAYLAFVGLAARPVIVPVPANEATLTAAMMWLKQDQESAPLPRVLSPIPMSRVGNGPSAGEPLLPSGTVLVFNPSTVNRGVLPDFPAVVGEIPATDHGGQAAATQDPLAAQQDSDATKRVKAPTPGRFRSERPEYRTNTTRPISFKGQPQESATPTNERGPQRPPAKSAIVDESSVDLRSGRLNDQNYRNAPPRYRSTNAGGPQLFSPDDSNSQQPHAQAPDGSFQHENRPHEDQRVTPADVNQLERAVATPAAFEDEPAVIPEGPALGRPARNIGENEPRRLDQNEDLGTASSNVAVAPVNGLSNPKVDSAPWYSSTIGKVWLGGSMLLLIVSGVWFSSRFGSRQTSRTQTEALNDLVRNRLPVTAESVRPPLGLKFHGNPQPRTSKQNAMPAPHLARTHFRRNTGVPEVNATPAAPAAPVSETPSPIAHTKQELPPPINIISDQERNLRAEFHQAWIDRDPIPHPPGSNPDSDQNKTPELNKTAQPPKQVADSSASTPAAPHFAARPKILANVPRVNRTSNAEDTGVSNMDDSVILARALANRKNSEDAKAEERRSDESKNRKA